MENFNWSMVFRQWSKQNIYYFDVLILFLESIGFTQTKSLYELDFHYYELDCWHFWIPKKRDESVRLFLSFYENSLTPLEEPVIHFEMNETREILELLVIWAQQLKQARFNSEANTSIKLPLYDILL
jgi:hypothetical protein